VVLFVGCVGFGGVLGGGGGWSVCARVCARVRKSVCVGVAGCVSICLPVSACLCLSVCICVSVS